MSIRLGELEQLSLRELEQLSLRELEQLSLRDQIILPIALAVGFFDCIRHLSVRIQLQRRTLRFSRTILLAPFGATCYFQFLLGVGLRTSLIGKPVCGLEQLSLRELDQLRCAIRSFFRSLLQLDSLII